LNKDNETQITKPQANSAPSHTLTVTTPENETNDPMLSKISTSNPMKQADKEEKAKKLFVVVSGKYF
jgi:hypothetical protein